MTDANARCQDDTLFATQIQVVDLLPLQCIARSSASKLLKQKNGGHVKRGGTLQCPPVRSGRPRTLRTEPVGREEHTNRKGARAVCTHNYSDDALLRLFKLGQSDLH